MKKNSFETILYSVAGVAILLVIIIAFNALTSTIKQRFDFTHEKAYTLSAGTKAILNKLDTPVKIRFLLFREPERVAGNDFLQDLRPACFRFAPGIQTGGPRQNHPGAIRSQAGFRRRGFRAARRR